MSRMCIIVAIIECIRLYTPWMLIQKHRSSTVFSFRLKKDKCRYHGLFKKQNWCVSQTYKSFSENYQYLVGTFHFIKTSPSNILCNVWTFFLEVRELMKQLRSNAKPLTVSTQFEKDLLFASISSWNSSF